MTKISLNRFQEIFSDPEEELQNFLNSGQAIMSIVFPDTNKVIELNQREVANLLIEIRAMDWECSYCWSINSGKEEECVMCGAPRR